MILGSAFSGKQAIASTWHYKLWSPSIYATLRFTASTDSVGAARSNVAPELFRAVKHAHEQPLTRGFDRQRMRERELLRLGGIQHSGRCLALRQRYSVVCRRQAIQPVDGEIRYQGRGGGQLAMVISPSMQTSVADCPEAAARVFAT